MLENPRCLFCPTLSCLSGQCLKGTTYLVGFLQLILSVILVGWIWSILWGYFMWDKKAMKKVVQKGVEIASK